MDQNGVPALCCNPDAKAAIGVDEDTACTPIDDLDPYGGADGSNTRRCEDVNATFFVWCAHTDLIGPEAEGLSNDLAAAVVIGTQDSNRLAWRNHDRALSAAAVGADGEHPAPTLAASEAALVRRIRREVRIEIQAAHFQCVRGTWGKGSRSERYRCLAGICARGGRKSKPTGLAALNVYIRRC